MSWQLIFTDQYNRRAAKFLKRHPDVETSVRQNIGVARTQSPSSIVKTSPIVRKS
jgi:hypothetical protein